jgi:hypothetical protein
MKFLRLLIISAVLLFAVVTAMSFLIPFNVRISRAVNIHATPAVIWEYVDDMHNWQSWNPFFGKHLQSQPQFTDTSGGMATSMEIGGTTIRWKEKAADKKIAVMQKEGFKPIVNGWNAITHKGSDSTTVQWYMDFRLRWYPWEKFSSLLFEKNYGARMEQGLTNLKKLAEAAAGQ